MADHISKMRRFAAELTLQCHFFFLLKIYLGLGSRSKYRKTKLLILADPLPPAKYAFGSRTIFPGRALAYPASSHSAAPLFFRTGLESALRTSNPSNPIEATGFARKRGVPLAARTIVDLVPRL
jgi:hypothetical protein